MRKSLSILFLLVFNVVFSQQENSNLGKHEIRTNVLSVVTEGKFQINYEYHFHSRMSLGIMGSFGSNDRIKEKFETGNHRTLESYQVSPFYRYALNDNPNRFYFAEVFATYNCGDHRYIDRVVLDNGIAEYKELKEEYSDVALGVAVGYKFYVWERMSVDFNVGVSKNLIDSNSPSTVSRVGIQLGYRF